MSKGAAEAGRTADRLKQATTPIVTISFFFMNGSPECCARQACYAAKESRGTAFLASRDNSRIFSSLMPSPGGPGGGRISHSLSGAARRLPSCLCVLFRGRGRGRGRAELSVLSVAFSRCRLSNLVARAKGICKLSDFRWTGGRVSSMLCMVRCVAVFTLKGGFCLLKL
jgi:hypothetical protein